MWQRFSNQFTATICPATLPTVLASAYPTMARSTAGPALTLRCDGGSYFSGAGFAGVPSNLKASIACSEVSRASSLSRSQTCERSGSRWGLRDRGAVWAGWFILSVFRTTVRAQCGTPTVQSSHPPVTASAPAVPARSPDGVDMPGPLMFAKTVATKCQRNFL
jgi:hypothetical protein